MTLDDLIRFVQDTKYRDKDDAYWITVGVRFTEIVDKDYSIEGLDGVFEV